MLRIDFSHIKDIDDLKNTLRRRLPKNLSEKFDPVFRDINTKYTNLINGLKPLGFTKDDENRIFRYSNGLLKHENLLINENSRLFNPNKEYTIIGNIIGNLNDFNNMYVENNVGVLTPAYKNAYNIFYLEDSEFYIAGTKVLIVNSVRDGILFITNNKVDSDNKDYFLKRIPEDVNYVIIKNMFNIIKGINEIIPIRETRIIRKKISFEKQIKDIVLKLNQIKQPYLTNFLFENDEVSPLLIKAIQDDKILHIINQISGNKFLNSSENEFNTNPELFNSGFKQINITLNVNKEGIIQNMQNMQNTQNIKIGENMQNIKIKEKMIIGISLIFEDQKRYQNHEILLIIDEEDGRYGILFDPSYNKDFKNNVFIQNLYKNILSLFNIEDYYVGNDLDCDFDYSFQENADDFYCISWTFYMGMLYILNDKLNSFKYIYSLGRFGLKVAITRFILYTLDKEDPGGMYEVFDEVMNSNAKN